MTAAAWVVASQRSFWLGYGVPVFLAILVHIAAGLALSEGWGSVTPPERVLFRETISAELLTLEAHTPEPAQEPAPAAARREVETRPAPARQTPLPVEPVPARPEPQAPERVAPPATEPAPEREPPPDMRWQEEQAETFSRALDAEAERLAAQQAEAATASYIGAIINQVERNWSRPPSARRGMQAELLINLVPTGELVSITVARSSGNAAFDRSAEIAVRQAAPFRVPENPALFEQRFRQLRLLFTPEDLRNR